MKYCNITIKPLSVGNPIDCETGDVSDLDIYEALGVLQGHFAKRLCKQAEEECGSNDPNQIEKYLDNMLAVHRKMNG